MFKIFGTYYLLNKYIKCNFGGQRCGTSNIVDIRRLKFNNKSKIWIFDLYIAIITLGGHRKCKIFLKITRLPNFFFYVAQRPTWGLGHFTLELSRLRTSRHTHSVELLWTSDQLVAKTSTYTTQETITHVFSGVRNQNPNNLPAVEMCLRQHGNGDQHQNINWFKIHCNDSANTKSFPIYTPAIIDHLMSNVQKHSLEGYKLQVMKALLCQQCLPCSENQGQEAKSGYR